MNFLSAVEFLKELGENNNKPWFDANRTRYEKMKVEWLETVASLIKEVASFDKDIEDLEPKNCVFRINRDVRFAKDKSPYKTNISAYLSKGGKKSLYGGYYIQISPSESFLAGGMWMPEPAQLQAIRQEIDYHSDTFKKIIENKTFVKLFGELENQKLSSVPKGFEKDNPNAELLKFKSFVAIHKLEEKDFLDKNFVKNTVEMIRELKPFNDFLNKAIES